MGRKFTSNSLSFLVSRSRMEGKAEEDWRIVVNLISEEKLDILGNPSPSSLAKHLRILEYYEVCLSLSYYTEIIR